MESNKDLLKEILLRDKLITLDKLDRAVEEQRLSGGELSRILVKNKFIDENLLSRVLSEALDLPLINVSRLKIEPELIMLVPKEVLQKNKVIPISVLGDRLTLAMADPQNINVIDTVKSLTGLTVNPVISTPKEIEASLSKFFAESEKTIEKLGDIINDMKDTGSVEVLDEGHSQLKASSVEQLTDEAPIIKLTDTILQQAVLAKASDVFVEPMEKTLRVRYRIDGMIREIDQMAKVLLNPIVSRVKVISNLDISEHRLPQDGRFKTMTSGNKEVDFRVSILPTALGEKICLRILDQSGGTVLDVDKLGFDPESLKRLKECSQKPHGMILTCGPTGSGKTTTLYSILKSVDSPEKNIVTVEDPVEYQIRGLNQVNIKPAMGLTFAVSLRSILRQDPDIIMIGEIRDTETLDIAVKAALTGHLVLSSLHTTTAAGSIIRMMNMGIQPFLICSAVLAIVAQRLLRKVCAQCREEYIVPKPVVAKVGLARISSEKEIKLYRAKGCKRCFNTGYQGRVGITEILIFTPAVKELILNRAGEFKIKEQARKESMKTMREDGLAKALAGLTTLEEVLRVTASDEALD